MLKSKLENILKSFEDHYEKMSVKYYEVNDRLSNYGECMSYVCNRLRRHLFIEPNEISEQKIIYEINRMRKLYQSMVDKDELLGRHGDINKFHKDLVKAINVLEKRLKTVYSKEKRAS